ncbi:hypothetical protein CSUI_010390 [Cystoisospora suis]|uniref:Uncharacterized protein n=1 Tax=Cystoisospora suis TaxID=483139 RepID=A0A2C6KE44_9APIC|nr:hypothetical protein CSUI_010390 [Cystoisospora suis]
MSTPFFSSATSGSSLLLSSWASSRASRTLRTPATRFFSSPLLIPMLTSLSLRWPATAALRWTTRSAATLSVLPGVAAEENHVASLRASEPSRELPDAEPTGNHPRRWSTRENGQVEVHQEPRFLEDMKSESRQRSRECLLALSLHRLTQERLTCLLDDRIAKKEERDDRQETVERRHLVTADGQGESTIRIDRVITEHLIELSTLYHSAFFSCHALAHTSHSLEGGPSATVPPPSFPPSYQPVASGRCPPCPLTPERDQTETLGKRIQIKTNPGGGGHSVQLSLPSPLQCCVVLRACTLLLQQRPLAAGHRRGRRPSPDDPHKKLGWRNRSAELRLRVCPNHPRKRKATCEVQKMQDEENAEWSPWGSLPLFPELSHEPDQLTSSAFPEDSACSFRSSFNPSSLLSLDASSASPLPAAFFTSVPPPVLLHHVLALYMQRSFAVLHLCSTKQLAMLSTELNKLLLLLPLPPTLRDAEMYVRLVERRTLQRLAHLEKRRKKRLGKRGKNMSSDSGAEWAFKSAPVPSPAEEERASKQLSPEACCSFDRLGAVSSSFRITPSPCEAITQGCATLRSDGAACEESFVQPSSHMKEESARKVITGEGHTERQPMKDGRVFSSKLTLLGSVAPPTEASPRKDQATAWLDDLDCQARFLPHVCVTASLLSVVFQTLSVRLCGFDTTTCARAPPHLRTLSVIAFNVSVANAHVLRLINDNVAECAGGSGRGSPRECSFLSEKKVGDRQVTIEQVRKLTTRLLAGALATGRSLVLGGAAQVAGASGSTLGNSPFLQICAHSIESLKAKDLCMLLTALVRLGLPGSLQRGTPPKILEILPGQILSQIPFMVLAELSHLGTACAVMVSAALRCAGQRSVSEEVVLRLLGQQPGGETVEQKERLDRVGSPRQRSSPTVAVPSSIPFGEEGRQRSRGSEQADKTAADIHFDKGSGQSLVDKSREKRWEACAAKWLGVLEAIARHVHFRVHRPAASQEELTPDLMNAAFKLVQVFARYNFLPSARGCLQSLKRHTAPIPDPDTPALLPLSRAIRRCRVSEADAAATYR